MSAPTRASKIGSGSSQLVPTALSAMGTQLYKSVELRDIALFARMSGYASVLGDG